jgi:hypothetical protein
MAEYIEREVALDVVKRTSGDYAAAWSEIAHMPAADVAEVRHGRWIGIEYDGYADGCPVYDLWECSECGEEVRGEDVPDTHPWCHACGTRMDKEDEHEAD